MNTQQLRHAVQDKWLTYYEANRLWITRLGVWVDCDGQRRPSSSFILAALSVLEPQLTQMFPFIVDLSTNPDRIVAALGLNVNPDQQLVALAKQRSRLPKALPADSAAALDMPKAIANDTDPDLRMMPAAPVPPVKSAKPAVRELNQLDESCSGRERSSERAKVRDRRL